MSLVRYYCRCCDGCGTEVKTLEVTASRALCAARRKGWAREIRTFEGVTTASYTLIGRRRVDLCPKCRKRKGVVRRAAS